MPDLGDQIIEHLAQQDEPVKSSAIADALGADRITVMRTAATLVADGIVNRTGNGFYSLGNNHQGLDTNTVSGTKATKVMTGNQRAPTLRERVKGMVDAGASDDEILTSIVNPTGGGIDRYIEDARRQKADRERKAAKKASKAKVTPKGSTRNNPIPSTVGELEDSVATDKDRRQALLDSIESVHKGRKEKPVDDYGLKLAVLDKLEKLYAPDIAEVLGDIRADLNRFAGVVGVAE